MENENINQADEDSMTKFRFPVPPEHWQHYLLCILLHMLLPLLPIAIEFWRTKTVGEKSLTLAASMYAIAIGISSANILLFGFCIFTSITFAIAYGIVSTQNIPLPHCEAFAIWGIIAVFVLHALERYNTHVADKVPFLSFTVKGD